MLLLALFYGIIDVLRLRAWSFFFVVIGVNAITIYTAERILHFSNLSKFFLEGIDLFDEEISGAARSERPGRRIKSARPCERAAPKSRRTYGVSTRAPAAAK